MSATPNQSPLGVNALGSFLADTGITINTGVTQYIGTSSGQSTISSGSLGGTFSNALSLAYSKLGADITPSTFASMLALGSGVCPALANGVPPTMTRVITVTGWDSTTLELICDTTQDLEANGIITFNGAGWVDISPGTTYWVNAVTSPSRFRLAASAGGPAMNLPNPKVGTLTINNWSLYRAGWTGALAYQAWLEFNYNSGLPSYADFFASFMEAYSWTNNINRSINIVRNSTTFLDGVYSNMNDLTSADISGITLSTTLWGQDLIALGRALDLRSIDTFGLPSNILKTLKNNNAITRALTLAALSAEFSAEEWGLLVSNPDAATVEQQRKLYATYTLVLGGDLLEIMTMLNCKTVGLESLVDLLDPQKLFPNSWKTLTVPIPNEEFTQVNSKIYYPIYVDGNINPALLDSVLSEGIGPLVPPQLPIPEPAPVTTSAPGVSSLDSVVTPDNANLSEIASGQSSSLQGGLTGKNIFALLDESKEAQ